MARFKILDSMAELYGRWPVQFGSIHREGLVVEFCPQKGEQWVGNFGPGSGGINSITEHLDNRYLVLEYIVNILVSRPCRGGLLAICYVLSAIPLTADGHSRPAIPRPSHLLLLS